MFFKRKESFFLDLGNEAGTSADAGPGAPAPAPVTLAVREPEAAPPASPSPAAPSAVQAPAPAAPAPSAAAKPMVTTAEAIAAELRAAQEARPAPSSATFAPDCLNPANAINRSRRTAGANLAGFKAMASELFKS